MALTLYGIIIAGISLLLLVLKRPLREFVIFFLLCGVFGAAEAVSLPMLGGSSLIAPLFCVMFVILRCLFVANRNPKLVGAAISANLPFLLVALYGVISAFILPRIFEGEMNVFAMRPLPFRTALTSTSQNITQSVYLTLSALSSVAGYVMARSHKGFSGLFLGWTLAALLLVFFALVDLGSFYAGLGDMLAWAKTAKYAILNQTADGLRRISGTFPEPSGFAGFGSAPLIFFAYLWLVNVKSGISGLMALLVGVFLALSTSSTAFATLAVLLMMLSIAGITTPMPSKIRRQKFITFMSFIFAAIFALALIAFLLPAFAEKFLKTFTENTIDKSKSISAVERGMYAAQGIDAFFVSRGFGIGVGSFRSSGFAQAVIGSMGVFGVAGYVWYFARIWGAVSRRTQSPLRPMMIACGLAALLMMTPPMLIWPSPDPGVYFGLMAGFVLGLDRKARDEAKHASTKARAARVDAEYREPALTAGEPQAGSI